MILTSGCFDSLGNDGAGVNYSTEDVVRITPFSDAGLGHRVRDFQSIMSQDKSWNSFPLPVPLI